MGARDIAWARRSSAILAIAMVGACAQVAQTGPVGQVVAEGIIVCPPPTARCELSGATLAGGRLLLVNDRATAARVSDSLLAIRPEGIAPRVEAQFLPGATRMAAEKLEAITTSPDGGHVFAITSFDRHDPANSAQDHFNVLLSWPAPRPQAARVLGAASGGGGASLDLRRQVRAALASPAEPDGPAYFKIEGLAALPDQLLIGVRETGRSFREARFTLTILSVPWRLEQGLPVLVGPARLTWRIDPAALPALPKAPVGLSDLAYDPARDRLWLLTSVERDEGVESVAGYLWSLDRAALARGSPPVLVRGTDGQPLLFSHKPEALAILADRRLLVVHDDDSRATSVPDPLAGGRRPRLQTEAPYQIVSVADPP